MPRTDRDERFLRFARAIALVSGVALPLGAAVPACAEETAPPIYDAGINADVPQPGIFIDAGISVGPDAGAAPADAAGGDSASADAPGDVPTFEVTGGPLMPPEFDEETA
jgi:hypothetical protein